MSEKRKRSSKHWAQRSLVGPSLMGLALLAAACGGADGSETAANQQDVVPVGAATETSDAQAEGGDTDVLDAADADTAGADTAGAGSSDEIATGADDGKTYTIADAQDAYREYVTCLRDAGVPAAPAVFTADGKIDIDAEIDYFESLSPEDAARFEDEDGEELDLACLPEDAEELYALIAPDDSQIEAISGQAQDELEQQLSALATCMRETFPDFPDPIVPDFSSFAEQDEEGVSVDVDFDPFPGLDPEDPKYAATFNECGTQIGLDVGPNPEDER